MPVQIITPQAREGGFDKFLRRLGGVVNLANSGINTYGGIQDIQDKGAARDAAKLKAENDAQGIYGLKEIDYTKVQDAKEGDAGAFKQKVRDGNNILERYFNVRQAQEKAKTPEELANINADTMYKKSQASKNYADAKQSSNPGLKEMFNSLAPPDQEVVKDLARGNASKLTIKNSIDSVMGGWDKLSDDQKVAQGRQLLKTLNSTQGADAIGAEEAKRLGSKLEFALGNMFNSNPIQFGRDLPGFKEQALATSKNIGSTIDANQQQMRQIAGPAAGRGLSNLIANQNPPSDMVTVSNGKETLQISQSDLAAAQKDGFNVLGGRDPSKNAR